MGKSHKNEKKSKKKHKHKERKEKKKSKKIKKHLKDRSHLQNETNPDANKAEQESDRDFAIPVDLMNSKSHAPETPEEYQKRQSGLRREVDPITGRQRLIKGDGEILEEIVSKDRHKAINKEATKGDGTYFENTTFGKLN